MYHPAQAALIYAAAGASAGGVPWLRKAYALNPNESRSGQMRWY